MLSVSMTEDLIPQNELWYVTCIQRDTILGGAFLRGNWGAKGVKGGE